MTFLPVYSSLGFDVVGDEVFRDLVIARVVEPTSLLDIDRVLAEMGRRSVSLSTRKRTLRSLLAVLTVVGVVVTGCAYPVAGADPAESSPLARATPTSSLVTVQPGTGSAKLILVELRGLRVVAVRPDVPGCPAPDNAPGDAPGRGHGFGHELTSNRVAGSARGSKSKTLKYAAVGCLVRHARLYGTSGRGLESLLVLPVRLSRDQGRAGSRTSHRPHDPNRRDPPSWRLIPGGGPCPGRPIVRPPRHTSRAPTASPWNRHADS
jgi:hypothetical protein